MVECVNCRGQEEIVGDLRQPLEVVDGWCKPCTVERINYLAQQITALSVMLPLDCLTESVEVVGESLLREFSKEYVLHLKRKWPSVAP